VCTAWGSDQNAWVSFGKQRWVSSRERRSLAGIALLIALPVLFFFAPLMLYSINGKLKYLSTTAFNLAQQGVALNQSVEALNRNAQTLNEIATDLLRSNEAHSRLLAAIASAAATSVEKPENGNTQPPPAPGHPGDHEV
jgi:hypothetical protein